jgi:hypothetical protein
MEHREFVNYPQRLARIDEALAGHDYPIPGLRWWHIVAMVAASMVLGAGLVAAGMGWGAHLIYQTTCQ